MKIPFETIQKQLGLCSNINKIPYTELYKITKLMDAINKEPLLYGKNDLEIHYAKTVGISKFIAIMDDKIYTAVNDSSLGNTLHEIIMTQELKSPFAYVNNMITSIVNDEKHKMLCIKELGVEVITPDNLNPLARTQLKRVGIDLTHLNKPLIDIEQMPIIKTKHDEYFINLSSVLIEYTLDGTRFPGLYQTLLDLTHDPNTRFILISDRRRHYQYETDFKLNAAADEKSEQRIKAFLIPALTKTISLPGGKLCVCDIMYKLLDNQSGKIYFQTHEPPSTELSLALEEWIRNMHYDSDFKNQFSAMHFTTADNKPITLAVDDKYDIKEI